MITEHELQKITKNYNWNGGNNRGSNVYFSQDMKNILISQLHGRTVDNKLTDDMWYNYIVLTKEQFEKFINLEEDSKIGSIDIKFTKDYICINNDMKIPLYYFKDFKKDVNSKYENTIQKFLEIKPIKESNSNYENYLTNLGFEKKDDFFKNAVHSYELIKDKKRILVICNKNSFDIHIKNQSFNGLDFERLKYQLGKILDNKQDKVFNENVIMTFSQFVNEQNKEYSHMLLKFRIDDDIKNCTNISPIEAIIVSLTSDEYEYFQQYLKDDYSKKYKIIIEKNKINKKYYLEFKDKKDWNIVESATIETISFDDVKDEQRGHGTLEITFNPSSREYSYVGKFENGKDDFRRPNEISGKWEGNDDLYNIRKSDILQKFKEAKVNESKVIDYQRLNHHIEKSKLIDLYSEFIKLPFIVNLIDKYDLTSGYSYIHSEIVFDGTNIQKLTEIEKKNITKIWKEFFINKVYEFEPFNTNFGLNRISFKYN